LTAVELFGGETPEKASSTPPERLCRGLPTEPSPANSKSKGSVPWQSERCPFGRLKRGKLTGRQREELGPRLQSQDPGLEIIHRDAAGIDVGSGSHFAAVPPGRDPQPIREFGSWTAALHEMAAGLISCGIQTVVPEGAGKQRAALL
jgi:hypothetical protein